MGIESFAESYNDWYQWDDEEDDGDSEDEDSEDEDSNEEEATLMDTNKGLRREQLKAYMLETDY